MAADGQGFAISLGLNLLFLAVIYFLFAVLRDAALGNVELRHHLDARDDLFRNFETADCTDLRQHAVDTVANDQTRRSRLEMNVAGATAQCVKQRGMHEFNDRAGILTDRS